MDPRRRPRVAVVNDYEAVVEGLTALLAPYADRLEVVDASAIAEDGVDVALYDTFGRLGTEPERVAALAATEGVAHVAVHCFDADEAAVAQALAAGADGHLSKAMPAAVLVRSLLAIAAGEQVVAGPTGVGRSTREQRGWPGQSLGLSEREAEVVALAAVGHRNAEIAEALDVSVDTIKTHLARAFRKLEVHNRTALSALVHTQPTFRRISAPVGT